MVDVVIDTDVASLLQKDRALEWVHEESGLSGRRTYGGTCKTLNEQP
jgi:hypothetical protein